MSDEKLERIKAAVAKRDLAMKAVFAYQDKVGIPEESEINTQFFSENEINEKELKEDEGDE
jgi:hypothetical protein